MHHSFAPDIFSVDSCLTAVFNRLCLLVPNAIPFTRARRRAFPIAKAREVLGEDHVILDHVFVGMDHLDDGDSRLSCADSVVADTVVVQITLRQCGS